ncbi:MAG TPA: cation:proton antiporter [Prolixibacteraceae bacterium]|nr:cation:proton antiporter [Prolixibacteraceae bacterium]
MEIAVLRDIVIIFALSTFVNLIFTKLKVPTILGYLLTGMVAGPHLLGLIHDQHNIDLMAEIGIVLLLFSIGLEFSLKHLLRIRKVVFFGGFMQVMLTALVFMFISYGYDLNWKSGIFVGFMAALSSSAMVLKILQDRSELTSNYGRTVLGILIFQDLMLVPLLLFSDFLGKNSSVDVTGQLISMFLKTLAIIAFVYVGNRWLLPKLLHVIALARNQELFMMSILLICLAIALLTSHLGMSLAFGAFLAGLMVSESEYSHNAFGSLIPFKDLFSSFFFVSVGMLLDLGFVLDHFSLVAGTVVIVLLVKSFIAGGTGFLLGHTFRGTVMVGLALSQVGEFSFILAKIGVDKEIITSFFYQLFLAVAVVTMAISPFIMKASKPLAELLSKLPLPKFMVNGLFPLEEIEIPSFKNHLVIIGKDSSSIKLSVMARYIKIPYISIIFDPVLAKERQNKGEIVIYGDAINEPILYKAHVDTADVVVISVGSIIASLSIIERVRKINKHAHILVRAKDISDIAQLYKAGADQIFPENFEIAIDLFERILNNRLMPKKEVNLLLAKIRSENYGIFVERDDKNQLSILDQMPNIEFSAIEIDDDSDVIGKSLAELQLRKTVGVTVVAIKRNGEIIEHPTSKEKFHRGDIVYVLGNYEQNAIAVDYFSSRQNLMDAT